MLSKYLKYLVTMKPKLKLKMNKYWLTKIESLMKKRKKIWEFKCKKASNSSRKAFRRCRKNWWKLFKSNRNKQLWVLHRKKKNWLRNMIPTLYKRSKVKNWQEQIKTYPKLFQMWRIATVSLLKRLTRLRYIREYLSMLSLCNVNSVTSFTQERHSSNMWKHARKIALVKEAFFSRYLWKLKLVILRWFAMRPIIELTLNMSSKFHSMDLIGR